MDKSEAASAVSLFYATMETTKEDACSKKENRYGSNCIKS
jgi:hypothetical protein